MDEGANSRPARRVDPAAHRIDTKALGAGIEPFQLEFLGSGGEFFRLWIVNPLRTVITLGVYATLARHRATLYFFSRTFAADGPLEFTAPRRKLAPGPVALLPLGVGIALGSFAGQKFLVAALLFACAILAPYLWASRVHFRLDSTSWRGVRLQFATRWADVYRTSWPLFVAAAVWSVTGPAYSAARSRGSLPVLLLVLAASLLATFTCAIRLEFNYLKLLAAGTRIGSQSGRWRPAYRHFVRVWLASLGILLACAAPLALALVPLAGESLASLAGRTVTGLRDLVPMIGVGLGLAWLLFLASAPARAYHEARMFQLMWNNVGVSHVARFRCELQAARYVGLRMKNIVFTLLSLGLYRPFARISECRMKTASVTLHVKGGLQQLMGELGEKSVKPADKPDSVRSVSRT